MQYIRSRCTIVKGTHSLKVLCPGIHCSSEHYVYFISVTLLSLSLMLYWDPLIVSVRDPYCLKDQLLELKRIETAGCNRPLLRFKPILFRYRVHRKGLGAA